jgi:uncharacterized RDD family membrane protein YckC/cytoskeletal protein CcmA (bactofilin family)
MNTLTHALRPVRLALALLPLASALVFADPTPTPTTPLHEIGAAPAVAALAPAPAVAVVPTPTPSVSEDIHVSTSVHQFDDGDHNRVSIGQSTTVEANETIDGNAVAVMGPLKVLGTVNGNAVAVVGSARIDGTVHGNAVVVVGTLKLGSHAHVDGNVVAAAGSVTKEPGAYIGGQVVNTAVGPDLSENSDATGIWNRGVRMGRPLAFGHHFRGVWILSVIMLGLYVLLALVFPNATRKCGDTLVARPGATFGMGILGVISVAVLFVLLLITILGIPVAVLVLPMAVLGCVIFGKAAICALIGRSILGRDQPPALAALIGGLLLLFLNVIPVLGIMVLVTAYFLGFACVLATLMAPSKAAAAPVAPPPVIPPVVVPPVAAAVVNAPPVMAAAAAEAVPVIAAPPPPVQPVPPPVPVSLPHAPEAALPRATFWVRMVALAIDGILIGVLTQMSDFLLPALAIYGAILWKLRGATIGGIIFGIKVVRLDGRPVDWVTSMVRALACFISLIALGLGFFWIAFDAEKQGWHDKIAGTVVVRLPKGQSLV